MCGHEFCAACLRRAFRSRPPWSRGTCPLCRAPCSLYSTRSQATGRALEAPDVATIFGSAFLQRGMPGAASYHFDGPDDCYIDYTRAPSEWRLDDGSAPPQRKPFEGASYVAAARTFTGTIRWSQSTFGGDARWEYEMVFSDDFLVICSGALRAFGSDGAPTRELRFPRELQYWRQRSAPSTICGNIYVQGGALGLASYHFAGAPVGPTTHEGAAEGGDLAGSELCDGSYISYEAAPGAWKLDDGSRPPAQKRFEGTAFDAATRTFTGAINWCGPDGAGSSFGGDARWQYTMVFSHDFATIRGGRVLGFSVASPNVHTSEHVFGRDLHYARYVEEEAQMLHFIQELGRAA